jgi:hypothetical protein
MAITLTALIVSVSLGSSAMAGSAAAAAIRQFTQDCQVSNPRLDRLAGDIERGDSLAVRAALDDGLDVDQTWRDLPAQVCRSLLLRSIWHDQVEIFDLLLQRGADPRTVPRESLGIPVRNGRLHIVRTLFALGLKPDDNDAIVREALLSGNVAMIDLLAQSGVTITRANVPSWTLTDDLTPHLVPKYIGPNDMVSVGHEACDVQELFGLLSPTQDGCEGTLGPVWLHFVVIGNIAMLELMIRRGANLSGTFHVWDNSNSRPFNAMDIAVWQKDTRMVNVLRRAGAAPGLMGAPTMTGRRLTARSSAADAPVMMAERVRRLMVKNERGWRLDADAVYDQRFWQEWKNRNERISIEYTEYSTAADASAWLIALPGTLPMPGHKPLSGVGEEAWIWAGPTTNGTSNIQFRKSRYVVSVTAPSRSAALRVATMIAAQIAK